MTVSLADAKEYLRVTSSAEDDVITRLISAAEGYVERGTAKRLELSVITQVEEGFSKFLPLFWGPDPQDLVITYTDVDGTEQTIEDATIIQDRAYPANQWPAAKANTPVILEYTAGYSTVPDDLDHAITMLVAHWYANREGVGDRMFDAPHAVEAIINKFKWALA